MPRSREREREQPAVWFLCVRERGQDEGEKDSRVNYIDDHYIRSKSPISSIFSGNHVATPSYTVKSMGFVGVFGSPSFLAFHISFSYFTCLALPFQNEFRENELLVFEEGEQNVKVKGDELLTSYFLLLFQFG